MTDINDVLSISEQRAQMEFWLIFFRLRRPLDE